ncbi:hypothetical protein H7B90_00785 [Cohnella xylanilytica]|uniref:ArpU family phage transcriptional regulator n=1 Tax=Cohnella xylanilytica TaxID=557555 RepID=A0A841TNT6_9BACL|nr:hypothetical protein [Cohnella xylanilytica]MBB6689927.1 hypothetical protein [Cohnella xylanilytica]
MGILQLEFYDMATPEEIKQAKSLLSRYRRHKDLISELEKIENLAPKQRKAYNAYVIANQAIERSVRLIMDPDIKKAVQMRYIEGVRRKDVVTHYRFLDPSTVDRRINRGIESVANSLKFFEG